MKRSDLISAAVILSIVILASFLIGLTSTAPVASATPTARIRVVHAVSDAPTVDIQVDGVTVPGLAGIAFKDVSDYATVATGAFTVTLIAPSISPDPLLTATLTLAEGDETTVIALGTVDQDDDYPLDLLTALDNNEIPPLGMARARFFHLVPGAPAVDIAIQGGPVLLAGVSYGQATPYVEIAAVTYDLELRLAGTTLVLAQIPGIAAAPNTIYSFFAVGTITAPDIIQSLDQQYVRLRTFHGVSDGPPVEIWLDDSRAFASVDYKALTDYAAVMSGTYTLGLTLPNVPQPILTETLVLTGGMDFTVAAAGTLTVTDAYPVMLIPYLDNNHPPVYGEAHLRFIHLVPDAPPVDVGVTEIVTPLFSGVSYREATGYVALSTGVYDLEAYVMGATTPVATAGQQSLEDGVIYTAFGVGLAAGPAPIEIVLGPIDFIVYLPVILQGH